HTYELGTRYSRPLGATFADEDGQERHFQMGCYGIGISRIVAAVAEQCHDEAGLKLPRALAPYEAVVVATNMDQPDVVDAAERDADDPWHARGAATVRPAPPGCRGHPPALRSGHVRPPGRRLPRRLDPVGLPGRGAGQDGHRGPGGAVARGLG